MLRQPEAATMPKAFHSQECSTVAGIEEMLSWLTRKPRLNSSRREFLRSSFIAGGTFLTGFDKIARLGAKVQAGKDGFEQGKQLGDLNFVGESRSPLDTLVGSELDGRLFSDLSKLTSENPVPPTEAFYVRTRASPLLDDKGWPIRVGGLVDKPATLSIEDLKKNVRPTGRHLMECSGNARATRFGMLSVADWSGTSVAGADWVFTREQMKASKAFLATEMNGQPLTKDHGAPVRLVVPGWYGCTCIKWVNAITFVDENAPATSQMQEFAKRTHQQGVPELARDYRPATIDRSAMPIRVEKWLVDGKIKYRVAGILWGGSRLVKVLEIRFNPEEDYVRVDNFSQTTNDPWSFWSHAWTPKAVGTYMIRLRVADPVVETKRLDSGYYVRSVEVTEV